MSGSIESYGPSWGPQPSGGGWGEGDSIGGEPVRSADLFVRLLAPGEEPGIHPRSASGWSYVVREAVLGPARIRDGAGRDIDDVARAATGHLAGDDPVLAYLLARHWAYFEGGPLIEHSEAVDASGVEGFVPGVLADGIYTYDATGEDWDGEAESLRYEVEVDDALRTRATDWYTRRVAPPRRELHEVWGTP